MNAESLTTAPVSAILETSLTVADLQKARDFYTTLFGYRVMGGDESFCALDIEGRQVLLLFLRGREPNGTELPFGGYIPPHGTEGATHIGFRVTRESLPAWQARFSELGIPIESTVNWPKGGTSLYFRDPDGHLLELLTPGVWPSY